MKIFKKITLILFCSYGFATFPQSKKVDSLLLILKTAKEDTSKALLLNDISTHLVKLGNNDQSLSYAMMGLALSKQLNFKVGLARSYFNSGTAQRQKGNYTSALSNYLAYLKLQEEGGDIKSIANAYNSIAIVYYNQNKFEESLQNHFKALKMRQELKDTINIGGTYNNIGLVYYVQEKFEDALKNFFTALKMAKRAENKILAAAVYLNVANIYEEQGKYEEAIIYYNNAHELKEKDDKNAAQSYYVNLGNVFFKQKNYGKANEYLKKGLEIAKQTGGKEIMMFCYEQLDKMAKQQGNYKAAYDYLTLSVEYRDSLLNKESSDKTLKMQMQYDFDKQATADSIKNAEQAKLEQVKYEHEIQVQKAYTYGGIIGFVLMLVVAVISFKAYRQHQKANRIISLQKTEVEKQKHLVEEKQGEILSSIHYALRIQNSLLPTDKQIENDLSRLTKK